MYELAAYSTLLSTGGQYTGVSVPFMPAISEYTLIILPVVHCFEHKLVSVPFTLIYERVAVGRKYPCSRLP